MIARHYFPFQSFAIIPGKMKIGKMLCLMLWIDLGVNGDEDISRFIKDIMSTFRLHSPTIIYNEYERAPEICYNDYWVLCLHPSQSSWHPQDETKSFTNKSEGKTLKEAFLELNQI